MLVVILIFWIKAKNVELFWKTISIAAKKISQKLICQKLYFEPILKNEFCKKAK